MPASEVAIGEEVQRVEDKVMALSGLRLIEIVKNFLCRFSNPLPLVVLSSLFETATTTLRTALFLGLERDLKMLNDAAGAKLAPFTQFQKQNTNNNTNANAMPLSRILEENPSLAAGFQPHQVSKSFAVVTGKLHLLNTISLRGSRVDEDTGIHVYDEVVSGMLLKQLRGYCQLTLNISRRVPVSMGQKVFVVANLHYVAFKWRKLAALYIPKTTGDAASPSGSPPAGGTSSFASDSASNSSSLSSAGLPESVAPAIDVNELQAHLKNFIAQLVHDDCRGTVLAEILELIREVESLLGAAFFAEEATASETPAPRILEESLVLGLMTRFSRSWVEQLHQIKLTVNAYFKSHVSAGAGLSSSVQQPQEASPSSVSRMRSVTPSGSASAGEEDDAREAAEDVAGLVMKDYIQLMLDCNAKLGTIVNTFYSTHGGILAKVVATQTMIHEALKLLPEAAR
jgi:hypothetical protein